MILGHELGHFANRDHLRNLGKTLAIRVAIASLFGDNATLANSVGVVIETISNARYSQEQEYQADEFMKKRISDLERKIRSPILNKKDSDLQKIKILKGFKDCNEEEATKLAESEFEKLKCPDSAIFCKGEFKIMLWAEFDNQKS